MSTTTSTTGQFLEQIDHNTIKNDRASIAVVDAATMVIEDLLRSNVPGDGNTPAKTITGEIGRRSAEAALAAARSTFTSVITAKNQARDLGWDNISTGPTSDPEVRRQADACHIINTMTIALNEACETMRRTAKASIKGLTIGSSINRDQTRELQNELNTNLQPRFEAINLTKGTLAKRLNTHVQALRLALQNRDPQEDRSEEAPTGPWELHCRNCHTVLVRLTSTKPQDYDFARNMGLTQNKATCGQCGATTSLHPDNWTVSALPPWR